METVTVELKTKNALKLLEEMEQQDIIKLHKNEVKITTKDKATKYRGFLSTDKADALLKHVEGSRNEWDERVPLK